ncbi:hypothetical protein T492DRAFT_863300 [Pavlovales sp. CCMP2436]|nr:hypothetical protein T492DRAFT_863300 [Pavlovales sp. CCMP2436]
MCRRWRAGLALRFDAARAHPFGAAIVAEAARFALLHARDELSARLLEAALEGDDGRSRPLNHSEAVGRARLLADHAYATLLRGAVAEPGSHAIGAGELVRPLADVRLALLEQVDSGRRERQPWAYALAEEPARL